MFSWLVVTSSVRCIDPFVNILERVDLLGDAVREFAGECGIEFADDKNAVIDHLNFDANDNGQVRAQHADYRCTRRKRSSTR